MSLRCESVLSQTLITHMMIQSLIYSTALSAMRRGLVYRGASLTAHPKTVVHIINIFKRQTTENHDCSHKSGLKYECVGTLRGPLPVISLSALNSG